MQNRYYLSNVYFLPGPNKYKNTMLKFTLPASMEMQQTKEKYFLG